MKRRIVLLGPPASGKGTQAAMIMERYSIPSASPGTMLRAEKASGTELGATADEFTRNGRLVPDHVANELVSRWLDSNPDSFVFDGYPRSLGQAGALSELLQQKRTAVDVVFNFDADLETLRNRVEGRSVCSKCAAIFSTRGGAAVVDSICLKCGGELVRRVDDTSEVLQVRMEEYREKSAPVVEYYRSSGLLRDIDATQTPEQVFMAVCDIIEEP